MKDVKEIELRELQLMEKGILDKFAEFCDDNGLRYTLLGGTLLGAVRHCGFIPWDDDIDVAMPRPDYDKFLQITKENKISSELNVVSGDYSGDFSLPFAKVFNKNTIIIEETKTHESEGNALWIDVMPYDGVGNDYANAKKIYDKARFYQKALGRATSVPWKRRRGEKGITGFFRCLYRQLYRIHDYNYYKNKLIHLGKKNSFDDSKYVAIVVSGFYGYGEILDKNTFIKYTEKEFENTKYMTMGAWSEYLTGVYGDYMKLPPEEKRVRPHNFKIMINNRVS